ncbi:MAG: ABC transporter permease subunit [Christensenella sp.]|uniref:ABC transporter permease subunit n=1 Tax=Christensenella sp. TaxID=1935934 RepID=UPI002B1EC99C|nr:ABC transporter permease subunit [Christensenella sp.]MEA5004296.1 ABC transporter permease subunit [Christensenella sp.]
MRNLIRANFVRLVHDKVFWIVTAALLILGFVILGGQYQAMKETDVTVFLESSILGVFLLVGIALAIFAPLFIGTEYSDGTMRNKLAAGAKRTHIYFAHFITCAIAGILIDVVYLAIISSLGFALLGTLVTPVTTLLIWIAVGILLTLSWAAIFTLITMLVTSKAVSAIVCVLLAVVLMVAGSNLCMSLKEPEFYDGMVSDVVNDAEAEDGMQTQYNMQYVEKIPNPKYIPPEQRPFVQAIADILPAGQAQQLTWLEVPQPWRLMLYSAAIIVIANGLGVFVFRRKDLK